MQLLKEGCVFLDVDLKSKKELFDFIATKLLEKNIITEKADVIKKFYEREELSPTGFENGIAIPHMCSASVLEPTVVVIKSKHVITDYESLFEDNEVNLVFAIVTPATGDNEHLKILSSLSSKLMKKEVIDKILASNEKEIIDILSMNRVSSETNVDVKPTGKKLLAITACPTGIAHTYMAAEYLQNKAKEMGIEIKVEKQGANGIEDRITAEDIKDAHAIIFAHAVALDDLGRFNGMKYIDIDVQLPIKEPQKVIDMALKTKNVFETEETIVKEEKGVKAEIMQAIMTGFSHMIPVIVAGGLLMGISSLIAFFIGGEELVSNLSSYLVFNADGTITYGNEWFLVMLAYLNKFGWLVMQLMYPMFCAYAAFSIGGKNALLPGLLGGILASGVANNLFNTSETFAGIMMPFVDSATIPAVPSGIFGAMTLALVAGYLVKAMNKWKFHQVILPLKTMLIIPGISVLVILLLNLFMVEPFFSTVNIMIQDFIMAHSNSVYVYCIIVAACTAFDLGGPVNKATGTVAIALAAEGIMPLTARVLSIVIPAIGIGVATFMDRKVFRKRVFDDNERVLGQTSFILGFMAIGEGAIPFMLRHPLIMIIINCTGAIIGSLVAVALGAVQWLPLPAVWGWPLVENLWAYLLGMFIGVMFIAIATNLVRIKIGDVVDEE